MEDDFSGNIPSKVEEESYMGERGDESMEIMGIILGYSSSRGRDCKTI